MCKKDTDGFAAGLLLGAVIGGVLGVLFAPDEGKKTRVKLKQTLDEKKVVAREFIEDISEKVSEAREKAEPVISEIREKLEPIMEQIEDLSIPVRERVAQYVEDVKDKIEQRPNRVHEVDSSKRRFFKGVRRPMI